MKLAKVLPLAFLASWVAGGTAMAQPPPFKWWQNDRFQSDLALTAEQSAKIEDIFKATSPKLRASMEELDRLETQLSDLMSQSDVTEAAVVRQVDLVEAARCEMSKTRTLMLFRIRQVLSPEQRQKLNALHQKGQRDRKKPDRH